MKPSLLPKILQVALSIIVFASCASKEKPINTSLAGNRKMGITIRHIQFANGSLPANDPNLSNYFFRLSEQSLQKAYGSRTERVLFVNTNAPLEEPENLYQIGAKEIDDLFLLDFKLAGAFQMPTASPVAEGTPPPVTNIEEELKKEEASSSLTDRYVEVSGLIHNGANLRAVTVFHFKIPTHRMDLFEKFFVHFFEKSVQQAYPNPNIYPKSNPEYFANLLYVLSKEREKEAANRLECDNAPEVLKFYPKAEELYRLSLARGSQRIVGQQSEIHQLTMKLEESTERSKILETCKTDQLKNFEIEFDYGKISPESRSYIQQAFKAAQLEELLRQYTNKPVRFRFQIEQSGELGLFVDMRFEREKYGQWIKALKIPSKIGAFQILSLDPYRAIMQKLVFFRASLPKDSPPPLRSSFNTMRLLLTLKTLLNGEVSFAVDGKYFPERKSLKMAYPNSISLVAPGFTLKPIAGKNEAIFQDRGWIALGNCKTLEGTLTEDGLLYRFFGLPCQ